MSTTPTPLATIEQKITQMIAAQETGGGTTGVGATQNNPGGIQYAPWEAAYGATAGSGGFASFSSLQQGFDALAKLVDKYISSGASVASMLNAYAPTSAGNPTTPLRIQTIAGALGLDPNAPIAQQAASGSGSTVTPQQQTQSLPSDIGSGVATGITQGLLGAFGLSSSPTSGSVWTRMLTGILGIVLLIIGLMMLRQTQVVIDTVAKGVSKVSELATA